MYFTFKNMKTCMEIVVDVDAGQLLIPQEKCWTYTVIIDLVTLSLKTTPRITWQAFVPS